MLEQKDFGLEKLGSLKLFPSGEIGDSPIGIGFECLDREMFDPERCYDLLAAAGVKWARCQTGWCRCETSRGRYDFAWLDAIVDNLLSRGIQPWFNVGFGNRLYMENVYSDAAVGCVPLYYGEEAFLAWLNFVTALARRYRGRVSEFEIWNEPDSGNFWQPRKPDPEEYARLIHLTGEAIRAVYPEARIGGCISRAINEFAIRLFRSGIVRELDFFSIHPYGVQPELHCRQAVEWLRRTLDENGGRKVELRQGESGYASWFPENHWLGVYVTESERNQAVWMLRRYFTDLSLGMTRSTFFQTVDMMGREYRLSNVTRKNPARHGILNGLTYTPKLSYCTMRNLATFFADGMKPASLYAALYLDEAFPRRERHSRLRDMAVQVNPFVRDGYPFFAYHLAEDMQYGFPGVSPVFLSAELHPELRRIRNPVLLDMLTGNVFRLQDWSVGDAGVLYAFSGLPLTDYPLVVCDESAVAWRAGAE